MKGNWQVAPSELPPDVKVSHGVLGASQTVSENAVETRFIKVKRNQW